MYLGLGLRFGGSRVSDPLVPANTSAPVVTGVADVSEVLTLSSDGTWTNTPLSYAYQWRQNGIAITGETASTYIVLLADQGYDITCAVTATNASGSATASSNTKSIPAAPAPGTDGSMNMDENGNPLPIFF